MYKRGSTTIVLTVGKPSQANPKGGTYDRLDKLKLCKSETFDEILTRLLDFYDKYNDDGK